MPDEEAGFETVMAGGGEGLAALDDRRSTARERAGTLQSIQLLQWDTVVDEEAKPYYTTVDGLFVWRGCFGTVVQAYNEQWTAETFSQTNACNFAQNYRAEFFSLLFKIIALVEQSVWSLLTLVRL